MPIIGTLRSPYTLMPCSALILAPTDESVRRRVWAINEKLAPMGLEVIEVIEHTRSDGSVYRHFVVGTEDPS